MKTQSNTTRNFLIYTALGTTLSFPVMLPYEEDFSQKEDLKSTQIAEDPYSSLMNQINESYLLWQQKDIEKINSIVELSKKLISKSIDIDSEYVEIVNDNFWDLI